MKQYDVAAYIWPAYTGDEMRTRPFWPEGMGEWQTVRDIKPLCDKHIWPRKPLWGYVNEADPYVMEMQIEAAADHGVNVFIYDWYWYDDRPFLEQCLNNGYLKAKNNHKVKFFLMWANHTATTLWDKRNSHLQIPIWEGAVKKDVFDRIVDRTIEKYFSHPSYYKIDGKPVYMIYDIEKLIEGLGGAENTARALEEFREKTVKAGFPGLELMATSQKYIDPKILPDTGKDILSFINAVFDSVTHYQFCHFLSVKIGYPAILQELEAKWDEVAKRFGPTYYPHVSVGWDSTPRYQSLEGQRICEKNTPENVKKAFQMAKNYVDTHPELKAPLITVNSWNEWTEGSYLEPDDLYGYGYLQAIKEVFKGE